MEILTKGVAYGATALLIGVALRYWMNRRRFNRRNGAGIQTFNSYEQKTLTVMMETFLRWVARLLMVFGLFLIVVEWFNQKSAEKYKERPAIVQPHP